MRKHFKKCVIATLITLGVTSGILVAKNTSRQDLKDEAFVVCPTDCVETLDLNKDPECSIANDSCEEPR